MKSIKSQAIFAVTASIFFSLLILSTVFYFISIKNFNDSVVGIGFNLSAENIVKDFNKPAEKMEYITQILSSDTFVKDWALAGEPKSGEKAFF